MVEKRYFHRNILGIILRMQRCAIVDLKFTNYIVHHQYSTMRLVDQMENIPITQ